MSVLLDAVDSEKLKIAREQNFEETMLESDDEGTDQCHPGYIMKSVMYLCVSETDRQKLRETERKLYLFNDALSTIYYMGYSFKLAARDLLYVTSRR